MKDIITITLVIISGVLLALVITGYIKLVIASENIRNEYHDCVIENNKGRLPAEKAWEVYVDICVPIRNDN